MLQTSGQYAAAGWPVPALMVEVDSPLAGALFLMQLFREAATDESWRRAWDVVWDNTPRRIRVLAPKRPLPTVGRGGLTMLPGSRRAAHPRWGRWLSEEGETIDSLVTVRLEEQLVEGRSLVGGSGQMLWNNISNQLQPTSTNNGGWSWAFTGIGIECMAPTRVERDDRQRFHNETGPAIEYRDGWGLYVWHGVMVPRHVIVDPTSITVDEIDAERNAEVRRVMIERMGAAIYAAKSGAVEIARDRYGVLLRKNVIGDEPIVVLQVINATPEPDGTFKTYHLRVPPNIRTPHEAVAWSFGVTVDEYDPQLES